MNNLLNNLGNKGSFFKNPIGMIGIFLVLTEGIASLVIVNSKLNDMQNTILVLFIALFPFAILLAFYNLVIHHHSKLYSPSDYKDEQNFVNTYNSVTQREERKEIGNTSIEIWEQIATMGKDIHLLKDSLTDLIGNQKKIVTSMNGVPLSEEEKTVFVDDLEDTLSWIDKDASKFKVKVSAMERSKQFVNALLREDYTAEIYRGFFESDQHLAIDEDHQAIWVGSEIPLEMAVKVIEIAKHFFPHLKYIQLNDASDSAPKYVKYQIFIGGATSTAKCRHLKELSANDFRRLYTIKDQQELHSFIKSFEP